MSAEHRAPRGAARGGSQEKLDIPCILREQSQWCWAACAQMVLASYGRRNLRQCTFATFLFAPKRCCPRVVACNQPCQVPDVCKVYKRWKIRCVLHPGRIKFRDVRAEIDAGRPVEAGYAWRGSLTGHAVIVNGYSTQGGKQRVHVHDPWLGCGEIAFSSLRRAYTLGEWNLTWTGLEPV